jgi:excisionase family DNA binding protein
MLTVKEAALRLGVSVALVYDLCSARQLRHSRIGLGRGKIVISEEAVCEYLARRECGPEPAKQAPARRKIVLHHLEMP